jgi:hypothetical protein
MRQLHAPFEQTMRGQTFPHPPQFSGSLSTFTQALPQIAEPAVVQLETQRPLLQFETAPVTVVEHLFPQAPQLLLSVDSETQTFPQSAVVGVHGLLQLPFEQTEFTHLIPQPPQLLLSVSSLTHALPQIVMPAVVQLEAQRPLPLQFETAPATMVEHLFPQVPQLLLSVSSLTHAVPQTVAPGVAQLTMQAPALQVVTAPVTVVEHLSPQAPQLAGSLVRSTHAKPVIIDDPHSVWPGPHFTTHAPPLHAVPAGQTLPQPPQLLGSVDV